MTTYVAFERDNDIWAYRYMRGWSANKRIDFELLDASQTEKTRGARKYSDELSPQWLAALARRLRHTNGWEKTWCFITSRRGTGGEDYHCPESGQRCPYRPEQL